jgi:CHAT domain-containing protein
MRFQMNKFGYGAAYHGQYSEALQESVNDTLYQLYKLILEPIAHLLTTDELIIIPHGLLHYVPFHALYDGRDHLLQHKTISYAPSATVLHHMITQSDTYHSSTPLVMGLADETIPYAQQEAESIAELFPEAYVYLGEQATIRNMAAHLPDAGLLHLSTHATFRSDNPFFSALKLADGWLSVNDFYHMADMPPLVTLSACETGRYQVAVGDELMGLTRGLFAAGARTIVVSLWMVEDETTARLMQAFYAGLCQGEPIHVALRQAQLFIRRESSHPYYWSPFIVIGDVRNPVLVSDVMAEGTKGDRSSCFAN